MFDMHLPKAPGCADSSSRRKHVAKVVSSNVDGSFSLGGWTKRLHEGQDLEEDEHGQSAQCLSLTSIADPTWPPTGVPLWPPLPNCAHSLAHQEQEYGCRVLRAVEVLLEKGRGGCISRCDLPACCAGRPVSIH